MSIQLNSNCNTGNCAFHIILISYSIYIAWWMYEWLCMCTVLYVCMCVYIYVCACVSVCVRVFVSMRVCVWYIAQSE